MSDREPGLDPELDELRRRLDAAFAGTRPRRGFEDELWARLQQRRPWWRPALPAWPVLGAAAAAMLVGFLAFLLISPHGPGQQLSSGGAARTESAAPPSNSKDAARAAPGAAPAQESGRQAFGLLPRPPSTPSGPTSGAVRYDGPVRATVSGRLPEIGEGLAVRRYAASDAVSAGTIFPFAGPLPATLAAATYPSRSPEQAGRDAVAAAALGVGAGEPAQVAFDSVQLVYVAVGDGAGGFLEPAYLFSGRFQSGGVTYEKRVLVPAVADSALRSP